MRALANYIGRLSLGVLLAAASAAASAGVATALEIGDQAPDFTLPATTRENVSLSQFRVKKIVLLEFYVHDFGPT
jgi:peroxiredoxin Q/BCP